MTFVRAVVKKSAFVDVAFLDVPEEGECRISAGSETLSFSLAMSACGAEAPFAVASEWPHLSRTGLLLEAPLTGAKHPSLTTRYSFVSESWIGTG